MGRDNHPKIRHANELKRRRNRRAPYARLLIVCEGEKTEPYYFEEIRRDYRLATTHVQVRPGALGSQPAQVVEYAERLFRQGDRNLGIDAKSFDQVYAVFDRDEHASYHQALDKAAALDGKLKNDEGEKIRFVATASVPCFELWLLLHYEDVLAPIHRDEVYRRLARHLPNYAKGQGGHWHASKDYLAEATNRAERCAGKTTAYDGREPFTGVYQLVEQLLSMGTR